jgi:hypothetical protein
MNKRQVLLAAAIASLSMVNVAQANEVASTTDVAVNMQVKSVALDCKTAPHSCSGSQFNDVAASSKAVAHSCSGSQCKDVKGVANDCST